MQTTAIDQGSGLVNLTTVLAHSSGEWIASDWPVCPIADMASPQRMGTALTYARRYALFTLVGIAGEDDLDAPNLSACASAADGASQLWRDRFSSRQRGNGRRAGAIKSKSVELLDPGQSAALRDKLLAEVANLASAEVAVTWANGALLAKNTLIATDAKLLEQTFEQKLSGLSSPVATVRRRTQPQHLQWRCRRSVKHSTLVAIRPKESIRAPSRSLRRAGIETASIYASSPSRRALSAAASPQTRIIFGTSSRERLVARPATNSPYRCAAPTTAQSTAPATSNRGGRPLVLTRLRSRASSGSIRE
jgi:hypothetical protein